MTAEEDRRLDTQALRPELADPGDFKERFGFDPVPDRQLDAALDVLRAVRSYDR
jgi:carboxyl-terminal processing protease